MDDEVLELVFAVKRAHRELERLINHFLRPLGITSVQGQALLVIADHQPLSVRDLGERMVVESGHPSRLVDRMVAAGWVRRAPSPDDRRQVELSLTAAGEEMADKVIAARQPLLDAGGRMLDEMNLHGMLPQIHQLVEVLGAL